MVFISGLKRNFFAAKGVVDFERHGFAYTLPVNRLVKG